MMMDWWSIFDWMGTVAFAISGAVLGITRNMDIFGIIVLAVSVAVGGGMVRDVLIGITPPNALAQPTDLLLAVGTAVFLSLTYGFLNLTNRRRRVFQDLYDFSDTVGLASFTVTGTTAGLTAAPDSPYFVLPVTLGLITAVGGGVIRDLMAQRMPVVLHMDVYAVAAIIGAVVMCWMNEFFGLAAAAWFCFLTVLILRFSAIYYGWQLFHPDHGIHLHKENQKKP